MFFRAFFHFFLIFLTLCSWGPALATPLSLYDENRVLNSAQIRYLESLAEELNHATGFELSLLLIDGSSPKMDTPPKTGEILLVTSFRQQRNMVKVGKSVGKALSSAQIEQIQRKYLFPEYKAGRYDRGNLSLAYYLAKEIIEKRGGTLTLPAPESTLESHMGLSGWFFVLLVFALLALAITKRRKERRENSLYRNFKYGRFGWR